MIMNVFRQAFLYLSRKRARTLLLFLILFFMGIFMLAGLSIRSSASLAAEDMQKSISTGLELKMDNLPGSEIYNLGHNESGELVRTLKLPLITASVAEELAAIPGVSGYYSESGTETLYTGLDIVPKFYTEYLRDLEDTKTADPEEIASVRTYSRSNNYRLVTESEYYPYFRNGAMELIAGRHLHTDDSGKILISEELAARNQLDIGDVIDGQSFDVSTGELYGETYRAKIVGIFRVNFEQQLSDYTVEPEILTNTIFSPYELRHWGRVQYNTFYGNESLAEEKDPLLGTITLFVEDPECLDEVESALKAYEDVDWDYYTIQRYDADYKAAAKPLLSMKLFAICIVVIMITAVLLILSLVTAMWMRSRKQEIHILTCLGMDRRRILAQFLVETGLVVTAAFLASCILAAPVTNIIGDTMTKLTNPPEDTPEFTVTLEQDTNVIHINRSPVRQESLSYHISFETAAGTLCAMVIVSSGAAAVSFRKIQGASPRSCRSAGAKQRSFGGFSKTQTMNVWHRAFLYLIRKPVKSSLLLLTLFIITGLFLTCVSVRSASEKAATQLRASLGGYFTLTPDYQNSDAISQIDQNMVSRIAKSDEIKAANAMDICYMDTPDISLNPGKFSADDDERAHMTRILGNTDTGLSEYFSLEIFELIQGSHIKSTDNGKALISSELAKSNQLDIGDHFVITTTDSDMKNGAAMETYELEIVGLFDPNQDTLSSISETAECDIPSNFIFTDIHSTQQIMQNLNPESPPVYSGGAAFYVKDPKALEDVVESLRENDMIDMDSTKLAVNNSAYQASMEPLNRLSDLSLILLFVVACISIILLTLILLLWERDRLHETGILMSFGISGCHIWGQRMIECITVFLLSLLISASVLFPTAAKAGDWLYTQTTLQAEQTDDAADEAETNVPVVETVDASLIQEDTSFHLQLSPLIVLATGISGITLTMLSVSIALFAVSRRKPKELLVIME